MLLILFLIILPLSIFFLLHRHKIHGTETNPLPPGPRGLPFIGNIHQLLTSTAPHVFLYQLSMQYGPLLSLKLGSRQTLVVVSSAEMAKQVLKTHDIDFCSRPSTLGQKKISYNGLDLALAPYGPYWKEIRKICVVNLFSSSRSQSYRPIREDEVSRMIQNILKSLNSPINLSREMMNFSSSVICRVAFGRRYEGDEMNKFQGVTMETQAMAGAFFVSDYFPLLGWVDRLTGMLSRLEKVYKQGDAFYQQLIDEHLDLNRQKPKEEDIVDILLGVMKNAESTLSFSPDHIKAVLMNVFVAGTDTTAVEVIWAMTLLMKNPESMRKLQAEVRGFIKDGRFVNEDDIENLPYLKAVVKETYRLQPLAPLLIPRETIRKCNIGGYDIPAKSLVYVNAWAIGRDVEVWGENKDVFYPERFLDSSIDYKGQDFELIPFGSGRRICPGMYMGAAAVELALANLVYKFDWEMPVGMAKEELDFDVLLGVTMHKKNALCLVAKEH